MALIVTGAGGLCLLCGVLLIGRIVGSYDLDAVLAAGAVVRGHALYPAALVLVLLGAMTKSAQFPFHFWLPHAMAAPTPVSAYLHSATMVKAGVFLMARLWPVLSGTEAWFWIVGGAGLCTLLLGAYAAMFQNDLKALLAYSTISHLGLITLLLGPEQPACGSRRGLPHDEPRDVQGFALHGGGDHRPRNRHPRHPSPRRPLQSDADHWDLGARCERSDGGSAVAQWLLVEGNVFRADGLHRVAAMDRIRLASGRDPCRRSSRLSIPSASASTSSSGRCRRTCRGVPRIR